jgi:NAD(P)-dependent dehydrogenase (short-subunit alcohol dehydrogenase family)
MAERENWVILGASGALGGAFVQAALARPAVGRVFAVSRRPINGGADARLCPLLCDLTEEASIAAAFASIGAAGPVHRVIIATGRLHGEGLTPEKALRDLDAGRLARSFQVNAIGPALVIKHALPLLPRDEPAVIAALSARVGSISDNRAGGWYGYRAAKAALNMMIRTAAIEAARRWPLAAIVGLHPGTVASALSQPFQAGVKPGHLFTPEESVERLTIVLDGLSPAQSGRVFAYDGQEIAP